MDYDTSDRPTGALALGDLEPAAELLKCLGHPQRLMIVCALMSGERAVSELERELAIRQPSLSQHLGNLRDAGLIAPRRRAKSVIYKISDDRVARIVDVLRSVFDKPARAMGVPKGAAPTHVIDRGPQAAAHSRGPGEAAFFARVRPREIA